MPEAYGPTAGQQLHEAWDNLRLLGRRALLAFLGIAIASATVAALLNIGHNAARQSTLMFDGLGTDLLVANLHSHESARLSPTSAAADLSRLRQTMPELLAVSPLALAAVQARLPGQSHDTVAVGASPQLANLLRLEIAQGRFLHSVDAAMPHAVLGAGLAEKWPQARIGDALQLGDYLFSIIGILKPAPRNPMIALAVDDSLFVPLESMRRITNEPQASSVLARSRDTDALQQQANGLQAHLQRLWPAQQVEVTIAWQLLEGMHRQARMFSGLLTGLGGVALLAGGIGVMNVMLMNVAERRGEIGVRMALGARPRDIASLFVLEAALLATLGAVPGCAAGMSLAWLFVIGSGWQGFAIEPLSVPLGIGSAMLSALFFALYPAVQAARMQPLQALQDV